jgi:hypothetical protein
MNPQLAENIIITMISAKNLVQTGAMLYVAQFKRKLRSYFADLAGDLSATG